MNQEQRIDPEDLIIIVTTSPVQSNPATEIIDQAISSIREQPSLAGVPMTIICDGAKVTEDPVSKFKSGIISEEAQSKYEVYKQKLRLKYGSEPSITIVERSQRYCFAQNIKHVMLQCPQPFVLVFQHDHIFLKRVDLHRVVQVFKQHPINYVGFMNKSVESMPAPFYQHLHLRKYFSDLMKIDPTEDKLEYQPYQEKLLEYYGSQYGGLPLMPLFFWYDKIHIARKSYYLEVIFRKKGFYNEITKTYQKTLSFVEDSFGTAIRKAIQKRPEKFEELRSFILWDQKSHATKHIHGRGYLTTKMKNDIHQKNLDQKSSHSSSEPRSEPEELCSNIFEEQ